MIDALRRAWIWYLDLLRDKTPIRGPVEWLDSPDATDERFRRLAEDDPDGEPPTVHPYFHPYYRQPFDKDISVVHRHTPSSQRRSCNPYVPTDSMGLLWEQEVLGSNPGAPTRWGCISGFWLRSASLLNPYFDRLSP